MNPQEKAAKYAKDILNKTFGMKDFIESDFYNPNTLSNPVFLANFLLELDFDSQSFFVSYLNEFDKNGTF